MNWKQIKFFSGVLLVISAIALISWLGASKNKLQKDYETAVTNNKAFLSQIDKDSANAVVFKTTIEQLQHANDSITTKLFETTKKLKIKDSQIRQLSRLQAEFKKIDTVTVTDTIFRDPSVNIDTVIGDEWVKTNLKLNYPNKVIIESSVKSEKNVVLFAERETIKQPKKFFLCRWLQKKHTVIKAIVDEKNPYIESQTNTFIQVQE